MYACMCIYVHSYACTYLRNSILIEYDLSHQQHDTVTPVLTIALQTYLAAGKRLESLVMVVVQLFKFFRQQQISCTYLVKLFHRFVFFLKVEEILELYKYLETTVTSVIYFFKDTNILCPCV